MRGNIAKRLLPAIGTLLLLGLALSSALAGEKETILDEKLQEQYALGAGGGGESLCDDPDCLHISVDGEGNVSALCAYGRYMLSCGPEATFSLNPTVEFALQAGENTIYRSGSYRLTGGAGSASLTVTQGRAVALLLSGAELSRIQLSKGSAASAQTEAGATIGEIAGEDATLEILDGLRLSTLSGTLRLKGTGLMQVETLNAEIGADSAGGLRILFEKSGANALARLQRIEAPAGGFTKDMTAFYQGGEVVMALNASQTDCAYFALPAPETGKRYEAKIQDGQIRLELSDRAAVYELQADGAPLLAERSGVLTSVEGATQSVRLTAPELTLQAVRTTGSMAAEADSAIRAEGSNRFGALIVDASASPSLRVDGVLSVGMLSVQGALNVRGSGVLEATELQGSGVYDPDPQCNFSVDAKSLPSTRGTLTPTCIQILGEENRPVANTRLQLKLGGGESFLTTTDSRGNVTLWREKPLDQADAVALTGGATYSAVILNGKAETAEVPEIYAATVTSRGEVSISAKNAGVLGVQYITGDAAVSMPDAWMKGTSVLYCGEGETVLRIPGLSAGQVVTLRAFAAREKGALLSSETSDGFVFSATQSLRVEERKKYEPKQLQTKIYNGEAIRLSRLPQRCRIEYFDEDGVKLRSAPVREGIYSAEIVVLEDDPDYLPGKAEVSLEIKRRTVYVYALDAAKQKGEADPEFAFYTDPLCGTDRTAGRLSRQPGEGYGNYEYDAGSLYAVDAEGRRVGHYRFVLSPDSGVFFIDWNYRHFLPAPDPLTVIDPVYDEVHFSNGETLSVMAHMTEMLNLSGTGLGSLVRDTETGRVKPFQPSLRVRQGRDEALLILTASAELNRDGGYATDRDGNPEWRGRTLRLGYAHVRRLLDKGVEHLGFSLKGTIVTVSLRELLSDETDALRKESGVPKAGACFRFDLIPCDGAESLNEGENGAVALLGDRSPLMRANVWLENDGKLADISSALHQAQVAFDLSAMTASGQEAEEEDDGVVETVNGLPVAAPAREENELDAAYFASQQEGAEQDELNRALEVWSDAMQTGRRGLYFFREGEERLESRLIVPYTASERSAALYGALLRAQPYLTAAFRQNGLYGLSLQ